MPKVMPKKPYHSSGCGPVCIKMAADYFSLPYSLASIERITRCRKKGGITNRDLVSTLRRIGLKVLEKKGSTWRDLRYMNNDENIIILAWMLDGHIDHFSVLDRVTPKAIYLADPNENGILKMPKITFMRLWFDYDNPWYLRKKSDLRLRWMAVATKLMRR